MKNSIMPSDNLYSLNRVPPYTEKHHIFMGTKSRNRSDNDGLFVYLTPESHRGSKGVHGRDGKELNLYLKQKGQKTWQEYYNKTEEDFIKRYHRSYL
jgi:hypothetical protein